MPRRVGGRQLDLLRNARDFRLLFLASVGSGLGTRLAVTALLVDVWDRTHSGKWIAALLIADFLPTIAIGLSLGALVDRLSRRRLMVGADLLRCGAFLVLPFATNAVTVVALAGIVGFANGFFRPALYASLPNLVADEDLPRANGLFQGGENVTWMVGPLLAGALLVVSGADLAYWLNAGTFFVSALLIVRIAEAALHGAPAESHGHWRDLADGFRIVVRERALLTVIIAWSVVMLANANVDVAEVTLAKETFSAGNFGLGLLMGAAGCGLLLGSLAAGDVTDRLGVRRSYGLALATMAAGIGLAAVSPNVWIAAAFAIALGIGNGVAIVANSTLVQRGAPDALRGRAFTVIMSVNYALYLVGMLAAGFLTDSIGPRGTWLVGAGVTGVAAIVGYTLVGPVRGRAEPSLRAPHPEVGVLHE